MKSTTLHIKNMVCDRCIKTVQRTLERLGYVVLNIELGSASVEQNSPVDQAKLREALVEEGFELIEDKKIQTVERIKTLVVDLIHRKGLKDFNQNFSDYISENLHKDYHALSTLFSQLENVTIERFVILQKIERAKELLVYGDHTLQEIARDLGYSSSAYLSAQFKQTTGFTPREFKNLKKHSRAALDHVA